MSDWTLLWPWALLLAPLPLLARWLPPLPRRPRLALWTPWLGWAPADPQPRPRRWTRPAPWLAILAWLALLLAAARPVVPGAPIAAERSGRDLMLAIDLSGSMSIEDMQIAGVTMDRLQALKLVTADFIERRQGDRLGLIVFGARAYLKTPLTFDLGTVRAQLDASEIGLAGRETAIGDALGLAIKRLRERPEQQRTLILLTDGANNAGELDPERAARLAALEGVRIHSIGFGADEMLVRDFFGTRRINPSHDLDERMLQRVAELTGGVYARARDAEGLAAAYRIIDRLEPRAEPAPPVQPRVERAHWPLAAAMLLALIALWLRDPESAA